MRTMIFDTKQPKLATHPLDDGGKDVLILKNEKEVTVKEPSFTDSATEIERVVYSYDGNSFRTYKDIADDTLISDDSYMDYEGDELPTAEMLEYAQAELDNYTASLIESGVI